MLNVFDAHCHIAPREEDRTTGPATPDRKVVGIGRLLCGTSPADWDQTEALAPILPGTIPAFGLHPWEIASAHDGWLESLWQKLDNNPDAWLGEAGLDRIRVKDASLERQKTVLAAQLRLGRELSRPASLHCVRAWEDILPMLDQEFLPGKFVMHAFAGPESYIRPFVDRGAYFSIGGAILEPGFKRQRLAATLIPDDRLLIESDAYVLGSKDGIATLSAVLHELAALRRRDADELAETILDNSRRLFQS